MKKFHFFLFVAAISCFLTGCRKPVEVSFGTQTLDVVAEGGTYTAELKSNGDWTLGLTSEWLSVSPTSGNGDATLTLVAQSNASDQVRSVEIHATTKDNTAVLTVSQEAAAPAPVAAIRLTPSTIECYQGGGDFEVAVETQVAWTVTEVPQWVMCSVMEGSGNSTVTVIVKPLEAEGHREADIEFVIAEDKAVLHISQVWDEGHEHHLVVTPTELAMVCTGESKTVSLVCDESWSAHADCDWITLNPTEGEGNAEIQVTAMGNPLLESRQCEVVFRSASDKTATVVVTQAASPDPHFLEVSPNALSFEKEGGSQSVTVGCDTEWSVVFDMDWLSASTENGTGTGTIMITAEPNVFNETRSTIVKVLSGTLTQTISVTQAPGDENYFVNVTPDSLFVARVGGVRTITIASNTSWTISKPSWITMLVASGSNDAVLDMMVDVNDMTQPRVGTITIRHNSEVFDEVVVVQEGITSILEADVAEVTIPAEGGMAYFHLTANQAWSIQGVESWFDCNPSEGSGDADILVKAGPLETPEPREATISITGSLGTTITLIVSQSY